MLHLCNTDNCADRQHDVCAGFVRTDSWSCWVRQCCPVQDNGRHQLGEKPPDMLLLLHYACWVCTYYRS